MKSSLVMTEGHCKNKIAIDDDTSVQAVPYAKLKKSLVADGQKLD